MIEILFLCFTAKQPSNPPPPPLPDRIVAIVPKEIELVNEKDEKILKEIAESEKPSYLAKKMDKIPRAKRRFTRRGTRNH